MALPEKPLTRRETYLAKAAGQAVTLPEEDITREEQYLRAIAEGGGGGGVTPEYVAEAIAEAKTDIEAEIPTKTSDLTNDSGYAAINDTAAAQDKTYSSAKVEEKVAGEEITITATGTDLTLSTSSGNLNALTVFGKSEVVDGRIISAGEGWATVDLGSITYIYVEPTESSASAYFRAEVSDIYVPQIPEERRTGLLSALYKISQNNLATKLENMSFIHLTKYIYLRNDSYTDPSAFQTAMVGVTLAYQLNDPTQGNCIAVKTDNGSGINGTMAVFSTGTPLRATLDGTTRDEMHYNGIAGEIITRCEIVNNEVVPLATPIITPLTAQEMTALAGLRTFAPTTHAQNNAGATMTVEAYAGTENGRVVNELKQDVQSEISALKITQSATLTLTTAGWSSNQQTVTYAHDVSKRNVIDIDPASVEEWASCGVLATAETATGITFKCSAVPENALSFKVTSMGVN